MRVIVVIAIVAAISGGSYWAVSRQEQAAIQAQFFDALGDCARDPAGAGQRIDALERMHGRAGIPVSAWVDISSCATEGSIARIGRLTQP